MPCRRVRRRRDDAVDGTDPRARARRALRRRANTPTSTTGGACSSSASATLPSRSRTACCRGRSASCSRHRARSGPTCSATRRFARGTSSPSTSTCAAASARRSSTRRSSASSAWPTAFASTLAERSWDGPLVFDCDDVIAATGFRAPLQDLPRLGVDTVSDGRIPAQTMFWESVSVPGIYFAGNATLGSPGLRKQGLSSNSGSVNGFRYNARILIRHLAEKHFGVEPPRPLVEPDRLVPTCPASSRPRPSSGSRRATSAGSSIVPRTACATTGSCRCRSSSTSPAPTLSRSRSRWRQTGRSTRRCTFAVRNRVTEHPCAAPAQRLRDRRSIAGRSLSSSTRC